MFWGNASILMVEYSIYPQITYNPINISPFENELMKRVPQHVH